MKIQRLVLVRFVFRIFVHCFVDAGSVNDVDHIYDERVIIWLSNQFLKLRKKKKILTQALLT